MILNQPHSFLKLPPEILLQIIEYLPYPDALSLNSTDENLEQIIAPTLNVNRRVEWLVDRASSGLGVPRLANLNLRNDKAFAANTEVNRIITQRRRHEDCRTLAKAQLTAHYLEGDFRDHNDRHDISEDEGDVHDDNEDGDDEGSEKSYGEHSWQPQPRRLKVLCALNPAMGQCEGVRSAIRDRAKQTRFSTSTWPAKMATMVLQLLLSFAETIRQHFQATSTSFSIHVLSTNILIPMLATGSMLFDINQHRLRWVFRLWTWFEVLIIVLMIAHFFTGVDVHGIIPLVSQHLRTRSEI